MNSFCLKTILHFFKVFCATTSEAEALPSTPDQKLNINISEQCGTIESFVMACKLLQKLSNYYVKL